MTSPQILVQGGKGMIEASVSGYPLPDIIWYKFTDGNFTEIAKFEGETLTNG